MRSRRHRWIVWSALLCWTAGWPLHATMAVAQALSGYAVVCTESGARLLHIDDRPPAPQAGGAPSCPVCAQVLEPCAAPGPAHAGPVLLFRAAERAEPWHDSPAFRATARAADPARAPPAA